jgi:hypothetical protein
VEHWKVTDLSVAIVITCRGHDRDHGAHAAADSFESIAARRQGPFTIIADLREMTGYESESRGAWQTVFRRHQKRINALVLIGARSALIRMGAAAVGAFAGIPVRFVASWKDIPTAPPEW